MLTEPIVELIIGAILTGLLIPYITGLWQIQKEEINIKRELLNKITELAFSFIMDMQFVAVYKTAISQGRDTEVELEKSFNKMNETYWTWEVRQAQMRTTLAVLFGDGELVNRWDELNKEMVKIYSSFESASSVSFFGSGKERLTSMIHGVQGLILKSKIKTLRPRFLY